MAQEDGKKHIGVILLSQNLRSVAIVEGAGGMVRACPAKLAC